MHEETNTDALGDAYEVFLPSNLKGESGQFFTPREVVRFAIDIIAPSFEKKEIIMDEMITLPCNCKCCMLVIEKAVWEDGAVDYNISIQDSRYDYNYNTLWGCLKRAGKILFGKPIYYNDVYLEGSRSFQKLIADMIQLAKTDPKSKA